MNQVATRNATALAALSSLKTSLVNVASSIVTTNADPYLRLLRDGSWVYGAENIEVEAGSRWAVNPLSLKHGWTAWTDYKKKANEKLGEVMVPASAPLPLKTELRKLVDDEGNECDWVQQLSLQFQCMTGEDEGEQVQYNTTSTGGLNAVRSLIDAIARHLEVDMDTPVPLVELQCSHYMHKTYGKTYTPELKIVGWVPLDDRILDPVGEGDTPDSDLAGTTADAAGQAADPVEITEADRRAAINGAMEDLAKERAASPAESDGPVRRRQRR